MIPPVDQNGHVNKEDYRHDLCKMLKTQLYKLCYSTKGNGAITAGETKQNGKILIMGLTQYGLY